MIVRREFILLFLLASNSVADVIQFDGLPDSYMFVVGGQNIGSYYPGVTFGPNITGLDLSENAGYPPHSGSTAVWDPYDTIATINLDVPQADVGFWYTSIDLITLTAYDDSDTLLTRVIGRANTDGETGTSDFLSVAVPNISALTIQRTSRRVHR